MNLLKKKQKEYWNNNTVLPWIKYDKEINYKFDYITKALFKKIKLKSNQSVLDIGCGSGFISYYCSKKVGANGRVLGIDISKPLLGLFKKKYKKIKNLSCINKDLEMYKLEKNKFNHAISRFGVMFFEDPLNTFKNIYNSLKKEGSISFACWTNFKYNQFHSISAYSVRKVTNITIPIEAKIAGPFSFKNKKYIQSLLKKCGFRKIKIINLKTKIKVHNIKTDLNLMMRIGTGSRMIRDNNLSNEICKNIEDEIYNNLKNKIFNKQKYYKANILLVNATK